MASESTAIAELISLARQKPIPRQSDEDIWFSPPVAAPPRRAPRAVSRPAQPPVSRPAPPPVSRPVPRPVPRKEHGFGDDHALTHRVVRRDVTKPLFAATLAVASVAAFGLTVRLTRHAPAAPSAAAAVAAPAAPAVVQVEPMPAAAPAQPTAQPIVQPIEAPPAAAPAPTPALVALVLESQPAGATVTLVDRGASSVAGTTPLSLSVDPSREYDVVFTLAGHPTKLAHIDPHATTHLALDLAPVQTVAPDPPAPAHHHAHAHAQARTAAIPEKATGTLMISSKPPCAIAIDGKPTGLVTPQMSITLAAGPHQVTLANAQQHVKKTFGFAISANHSTKLIRDLMK